MYNPIGEALITVNVLNVRQGTNKETSLLGILQKNQVVEVYDIDPQTGWYLIGPGAYISNEYVEYTEVTEVAVEESYYESEVSTTAIIGYVETSNSSIRVYSEPDEAYETNYILSMNDVINVHEMYESTDEIWYKVGENAWIKNMPSDLVYYEY